MIIDPVSVFLTAHIAEWADDRHDRTAWILDCLTRHNSGDWGDLGDNDTALNTTALRHHDGRLLSRYELPDELADPAGTEDAIWIITDDLDDDEPITTILWPSEY